MTRLVIFDCDGTLVDSQNGICAAMELAFQACSLPPPTRAETLSIVGLSLSEAMAVLAPTLDGRGNRRLVEAFREATIEVRAKGHEDTLYAGAAQAIADLAGRDTVLLGVATGKSRRGVARLFERHGWQPHFTTIQTADDNPSKPHPQMLLTAMAETGAAPHETIMIGDTSYDITMARAAGVLAIGVSWGYHPQVNLEQAGAHEIVLDFDDLGQVLARQFTRAGR